MSQAELKKKVIEEMGKKGMIDHLQALYIAKVAEEIQKSDLDVLKPYRSIRTGESYNLATQIVMQYLSKKNFELALKSAVSESEGKLQDGKDAPKSLKIKEGDLWLSGLLKVWEKSREKDAAASKEFMQREIGKRLGGLDENQAPGAEPAARAQPRAKAKQQSISAKNRMSVNPDVVVVQSDESTQGVEEESDVSINADLDSVDLGDDSVQVGTPSKRKGNESRSRLSANEPSDFPDEDIDFDTPSPPKKGQKKANADDFDAPTPPKKGGAKPAQKKKAMESDDDFDEPPPKKGAAKPQQQKKATEADDDFDAPSPLKKGAAKAAQQAAQESDFDDEDIDIGLDDDFDAPSPKKNPAPAEKPKQQKEESDFDDEDIDIGLDDDFDKPSPQKKPESKKPELVPEKAQESSDYSDVPLLEDDDSPVKVPTRKDDSTFNSPTKPIAATQPLRPSAQPSKAAPPAQDDDDFDDIALDPTDSLDETLGSSKKSKGFVAEYSDDFDKPNRKSPSPQKAGADDDPFGEEDVDIDLGFDDDDDPGPSPRSAKGATAVAKTQPSIPKPAAQSKVVKVNSSDADDISVDLSSDDLEIDIN